MIEPDLETAKGPPPAVLRELERVVERRRRFDAPPPADEEEAHVAARGHAILDEIEEIVCEDGARAPELAGLWQQVGQTESRMRQLRAQAAPLRGEPAVSTAPAPSAAGRPARSPAPKSPRRKHHPPRACRPPTEGDLAFPTTAIDIERPKAA